MGGEWNAGGHGDKSSSRQGFHGVSVEARDPLADQYIRLVHTTFLCGCFHDGSSHPFHGVPNASMPRLAAPCGDVGDKDGRLPQGVKVQRFPLKAGTAEPRCAPGETRTYKVTEATVLQIVGYDDETSPWQLILPNHLRLGAISQWRGLQAAGKGASSRLCHLSGVCPFRAASLMGLGPSLFLI